MLRIKHGKAILLYICFNAAILFIMCLSLHIYRYRSTPAPIGLTKPFDFISLSETWRSCKSSSVIALIVVTSALGFSTAYSLTKIGKHVSDNKWLTTELKDAAQELVLQSRNTIPHFEDVLKKAARMLEIVDNNSESEVKIATFWPMFGADLGPDFKKNKGKLNKDFQDRAENKFYYYLFRRFVHNMPTKLVFLEYENSDRQNTKLNEFVEVLSKYKLVPDMLCNFSEDGASFLKENVPEHIKKEIVPRNMSNEHIEIKVADSIPVLLFISKDVKAEPTPLKEGLLFMDNVEMMRKNSAHGGFYTQKPDMVDILEGLFASVFELAKPI